MLFRAPNPWGDLPVSSGARMTFWIVVAAIAAFMFKHPLLGGFLLFVAFLFPGGDKSDK